MKFSPSLLFFLPAFAVGSNHKVSDKQSHRHLSYEDIWTYEPHSIVTDQLAIDWDLHRIKEQLAYASTSSFQIAQNVYREGGYSMSAAKLLLDDPIPKEVSAGAIVLGVSTQDDTQVKGSVLYDVKQGDRSVVVAYYTSYIQETYMECQVGASPVPITKGCFASSAKISLPDDQLDLAYTYDVDTENLNFRTIAGFSTKAKQEMNDCSAGCPYADYTKFVNYYGKFDYADDIVTAAFNGGNTPFVNGIQNFKIYGAEAKGEIIDKVMVTMNFWMYVIKEMEESIHTCSTECQGETCIGNKRVGAWDEAVAYYTGSRHALPDNDGNLLFEFANKRCPGFRTCGPNGNSIEGDAWINYEIFKYFSLGQRNIAAGRCSAANKEKEKIVSLMTVPLVQGAIRYAHILAGEDTYNEKHGAEGVAYAMSVLPLVHDCSPNDARIIYEELRGRERPAVDFLAVKRAFERNYHCLNIQCSEVGGVYDVVNLKYKESANPCGFTNSLKGMTDKQKTLAISLGLSVAGILVVVIVVLIASRSSERGIAAQTKSAEESEAPELPTDAQMT